MSIADALLDELRALPPDKQQEVLDFAKFLRPKLAPPEERRRRLRGLWKDLNIDITEEDIAEARREMWGNFPREDV